MNNAAYGAWGERDKIDNEKRVLSLLRTSLRQRLSQKSKANLQKKINAPKSQLLTIPKSMSGLK